MNIEVFSYVWPFFPKLSGFNLMAGCCSLKRFGKPITAQQLNVGMFKQMNDVYCKQFVSTKKTMINPHNTRTV